MKIALDAFGSDNAPSPEVEGAVLAIKENFCEKIFLVGKENILKEELKKYKYDSKRIEIVNADEVITMNDAAARSIRKKKESSMVKAVSLVKENIAEGVVTAGNSGAAMAASLFGLGRIKNVKRPALATTIPTEKNPLILIDAGANVDCNPKNLKQFAILGNLYSKFLYNKKRPKVGLLNIGEEEKKGNELTKEAFKLISNLDLNFIGNIEGKDLLKGDVDVVVCDGFIGNVILKTLEGMSKSIFSMLKKKLSENIIVKLGALLSYSAFKSLKKKVDYAEYGGALLVGVKGISIIGHGRSNAKAIKNAIKFSAQLGDTNFINQATEFFKKE